ncbi:MAG: glycine cleavage system aminomethyltransferase GcvT [Alphaproteobacteria bacterium]|nr:glycine cleavage system aminomethyltransferase GcvT [Alphaproteobacteria bacterium]
MDATTELKRTPLYDLHVALGGKMVEFAGYALPVHYPTGILKEHLHTRAAAGLFDVSHMGQRQLVGPDHGSTARALEALTPGDILGLATGRMRYTMLLNDQGGMVDDLMVTRSSDEGQLGLVFNGARKDVDDAYVRAYLPRTVELVARDDRALLALQGPKAAAALARHCPQADALSFMTAAQARFDGIACHISRSGYTGEDGFEISVPAEEAEKVARALLAEPEVLPIGLGARDSLRLEAGLCLYGHDIDETTSPVEANLVWAIGKRRKLDRDFPAAAKIMDQLFDGAARKRVGLRLEGRAPAREGAEIASRDGQIIGRVTSGGFSPSLNAPIAMGYVMPAFAEDGSALDIIVRGKALPAHVAVLPFVPNRYKR